MFASLLERGRKRAGGAVSLTGVSRRSDSAVGGAMSDPTLAKAEKCLAAWDAFRALGERQPVPLYSTEHDEWERQQNKVADAWRDALCDLLATVPTTLQGAIALIDAGLRYQADMDRTQYSELVARLKAFLQSRRRR